MFTACGWIVRTARARQISLFFFCPRSHSLGVVGQRELKKKKRIPLFPSAGSVETGREKKRKKEQGWTTRTISAEFIWLHLACPFLDRFRVCCRIWGRGRFRDFSFANQFSETNLSVWLILTDTLPPSAWSPSC